jgi:RNA polymerase sigma factor (sigma-70 family)
MSLPPTSSGRTAGTETSRWFVEEVHPHALQLRGYLRQAFPGVRDVDDVVQESFLRIWKARTTQPVQSVKAFLFRVARNLAIDMIRHERASPIDPMGTMGSLVELPVLEDRPGVAETLTFEEKARLLGQALGSLPERCRDIIFLHKIQGLSQRAVAEKLGLSEKTVANQIGLGVNRCEAFFRRRGIEFF